jgi:hypothetical protein
MTTLGKWYLKDTKSDPEFINKFPEFYYESSKIWDIILDAVKGIIKTQPQNKKQIDPNKTTPAKPPTKSVIFESQSVNSGKKETTLNQNKIIVNNSNLPINNNINSNLPQINQQQNRPINKAIEAEIIKFFEEKGGCIYENMIVEYFQTEIGVKKTDFEDDLTVFLKNSCNKIGSTYFIKSLNDASLDPV